MNIAQRIKHRQYEKKWRKRNPDKVKEKSRNWQRKLWKNNPELAKERQRRYRRNTREKVIKLLGGKCNCCQESQIKFLAFDHINNDGNIQRKKDENVGYRFYLKIFREKPKDIQLLCNNCNIAKNFYGKCPHQI